MDSREVIINAERSDRMDTELQSNINFLSYMVIPPKTKVWGYTGIKSFFKTFKYQSVNDHGVNLCLPGFGPDHIKLGEDGRASIPH